MCSNQQPKQCAGDSERRATATRWSLQNSLLLPSRGTLAPPNSTDRKNTRASCRTCGSAHLQDNIGGDQTHHEGSNMSRRNSIRLSVHNTHRSPSQNRRTGKVFLPHSRKLQEIGCTKQCNRLAISKVEDTSCAEAWGSNWSSYWCT